MGGRGGRVVGGGGGVGGGDGAGRSRPRLVAGSSGGTSTQPTDEVHVSERPVSCGRGAVEQQVSLLSVSNGARLTEGLKSQ